MATESRQPPEFGESPNLSTRTDGIRRARRISNWTAAALIVGAGATAVALGHNALPAGHPSGANSSTTTSGTGQASHSGTGPRVSHSVATTSGSGVTTTTTRTVHGKTIVTTVRHPGHGDD